MDTLLKVFGLLFGLIAIIVVVGLLVSLPVMWLWNGCLVAAIPGIQPIGWLQAWGINILCGLLFKSTVSSNSNS